MEEGEGGDKIKRRRMLLLAFSLHVEGRMRVSRQVGVDAFVRLMLSGCHEWKVRNESMYR
jgi:hypothetical protein